MFGLSYWVIYLQSFLPHPTNPPYHILPTISGLCWLGTLTGLLIHWTTTGRPFYPSMATDQSIAFISDIGAYELKPLFITGSVITTIFLDLALISERWLRHSGKLARNITTMEKWLSGLSIAFAFVGTVGLISLSILDTYQYASAHRIFLAVFVLGFIASAICSCWQYQRLGMYFREHRYLRASFWLKLVFIITEVILAVVFVVFLIGIDGQMDVAAILEWILAFLFSFYIFSFVLDLHPASSRCRDAAAAGDVEMKGASPGQWTMVKPNGMLLSSRI